MRWAYGVMTCSSRRDNLLQQTLQSLFSAGFNSPRLFVDGARNDEAAWWEQKFNLPTTVRYPAIKTAGNWVLSIYELYIRHPDAERYALFQDDLIAVNNLRRFLERSPYPDHGYWNLYTFPQNQVLAPGPGWFEGKEVAGHIYHGKQQQAGLGAVALVFSREALIVLLTAQHLSERPSDVSPAFRRPGYLAGQVKIDGGIVESMNKAGWREWVHNPSLVQHTGYPSSINSGNHPQAESFPGENFDALTLLPTGIEFDKASWEAERLALERAIEGDKAMMAQAVTRVQQEHFRRLIEEYSRKLEHHLTLVPPC